MNTYELCKGIRKLIVNRAADVMNYTSWDYEFATQQIREIVEKIINMDDFFFIDVRKLTSEQMDDLNFGVWSEESEIRLIPLWLFQFLIEECEYISITGEMVSGKSNIDDDNRFGCIAYGVVPAKNEEVEQ